jgi:phage terminase large subunit GpA-like protein
VAKDTSFSIGETSGVLAVDNSRFAMRLAQIALNILAKENSIDLKSWIEEKITLPPGNGYKGVPKMNFNTFPHIKQILKLVDNPDCKKIVLCFAAQTGKSDTLASIAAYLTGYRNRRGLFVLPTAKMVDKVRETRLLPLFQNSSKDIGFQYLKDKTVFNFSGNFFSMALASSPATMAEQTSTSWVIIDEHDEFNLEASKSADPVKLSERRMQASQKKLLILASTPKKTGAGYTYDHYRRSKEFIEEIQCPLCGSWFVPDFYNHFKWPKEAENGDLSEIEIYSLAWVECPHCLGEITDAMHFDIVTERKRWKDLDPDMTIAECGFRLPCYLTPNRNFSSIVSEYLKVKNNPMELDDFNNSVLAKPVEAINSRTSAEIDYSKLKSNYYIENLDMPEEVFALTAGADIGKSEIWFTLLGWATRDRKFVIRSEKIERGRGADSLEIAMDKATKLCTMDYKYKGSYKPRFFGGLVDSGYDTDFVYDYCLKKHPLWTAAKGYTDQLRLFEVSTVDKKNKISKYSGLPLVILNTDMLNSSLHEYLSTPPGERHSIAFPADASYFLFEHLAAQEQHEIPGKYNTIYRWGKLKGRPDHLRDCLLHAIAIGIYRGFNSKERVE